MSPVLKVIGGKRQGFEPRKNSKKFLTTKKKILENQKKITTHKKLTPLLGFAPRIFLLICSDQLIYKGVNLTIGNDNAATKEITKKNNAPACMKQLKTTTPRGKITNKKQLTHLLGFAPRTFRSIIERSDQLSYKGVNPNSTSNN